MRASFTLRLRDREVEVSGDITPREADVGIMSEGVENYTLLDPATGMALDWELTDEEAQSVQDGAAQWFADDEEPDLERG